MNYSEVEGTLHSVREYDDLVLFELREHSGLQFMLRNYVGRRHFDKHLAALQLARHHEVPVQLKVWAPDPADANFRFVERVRHTLGQPLALHCVVERQGRREPYRLSVTREEQIVAILQLLAADEMRDDCALLSEMVASARLLAQQCATKEEHEEGEK